MKKIQITESDIVEMTKMALKMISEGRMTPNGWELDDPDPNDEHKEKITMPLKDLTFQKACEIIGQDHIQMPDSEGNGISYTTRNELQFERYKKEAIDRYGDDIMAVLTVKPSIWYNGLRYDHPEYNANKKAHTDYLVKQSEETPGGIGD